MANILLIDDEASIRRTLKEILEFEKYQVLEAPDGFSAIDIFKKSAIDIVLLDIKMPKTLIRRDMRYCTNLCLD